MRYGTFVLLISLCIMGIMHPDPFVKPISNDTPPKFADLETFNLKGTTTLFGVSVYSFMCQHSLPSLITPIRNQASPLSFAHTPKAVTYHEPTCFVERGVNPVHCIRSCFVERGVNPVHCT